MNRRALSPLARISVIALLASAAIARGQPSTAPVSREEYERLLRNQEQMRQELERLKAERSAPVSRHAIEPSSTDDRLLRQKDFDELQSQMKQLGQAIHEAQPGKEHFLLVGDAAVGLVGPQHGNATFSAAVSPLLLWEPTDRLLFEAAFDAGISTDATNSSSTSFDLTIADASFILGDHLIVGGGLFVVPFGQYHNHFDPPWINKLPDDPLVFSDGGIAPSSEVGIFARGAYAIPGMPADFRRAKVTYDLYVTNGPILITNDPAAAGSLNFQDFTDLNNGKAVGGRIGLLPLPGMETGYSVQYSQAAPSGFQHAYVLLQAADLNWVQEVRPLGGTFTARAEWVWSQVEDVTYDPHGRLGFGPRRFGNWRNGGYALIAYRPTLSTNRFVRNTEFVFRYDAQRMPLGAPGGAHEQRYTLGVDYWVTPSAVLKIAYEIDDLSPGHGNDAFFVQLGLGL